MKKKLILIVTALTLCAAVAVGATLAYLSAQSNVLENEFVYNADDPENNIKITLTEDKWSWEGKYHLDGNNVPKDPAPTTPVEGWGIEKKITPGANANKNPVLHLTSKVDTYMGIGVELKDKAGNPINWAEFDEYAFLKTGNSTATALGQNWFEHKTVGNVRYFYYTEKVTTSTPKTTELFQLVKFRTTTLTAGDNIDVAQMEKYANIDMIITGYGTQATVEDETFTAIEGLGHVFDFFK